MQEETDIRRRIIGEKRAHGLYVYGLKAGNQALQLEPKDVQLMDDQNG